MRGVRFRQSDGHHAMAMSTLAKRVTTAIVLLAICIGGLAFAPPWLWTLGVAAAFTVGAFEWARLTALPRAATVAFCACVGASIVLPMISGHAPAAIVPGWAIACIAWLVIIPRCLLNGAPTGARAVLLGWLVLAPAGAALAWLGAMPAVLLPLLAIVWIADTAAFFTGRRFGRRKLAPAISPGKTWEGVIGGLAAVCLYVAVLQFTGVVGSSPLGGVAGWPLALSIAMLSVVGDLFESLMKRHAGAKDSGTLLPGHGGVLDRIDGLTSTLPLTALAVYLSHG
jgi:phosphatidate cytidylyltransferase